MSESSRAVAALQSQFSDKIQSHNVFREEDTLMVKSKDLIEILAFCKSTLGFEMLLDISSVDHFEQEPRFEMVYELYSLEHADHLRIKCALLEDEEAPTATGIWRTADWHEREVFDMMGIRFTDHPDLRRILMWEGYPYYPLRKEFPLEGKPSEMPDVAFTGVAPLEGGPFVTAPTTDTTVKREPRARHPEPAPRRDA